ncbi:immunoglobulin domain-containing protein [Pedosphaera parvula]|uniref:Immunoglobulin I-set domain protein n=1 Tax=Pedosphaera parvula (strain Ellin514) TaxID=320771 RepID=B9XEH0_PEDPL|nr:immunoglobulin domain-containing protein [Pedosphaera parvula]EEF61684.1 Immunoglobulin I-set domain protein [Pedosphaera parvula Ellin514]
MSQLAIAAGDYYALAVQRDGTVVAWGNDSAGQSDVPEGLANVVAVAAGENHSVALKEDGTVVTWGAEDIVPAGLDHVVSISASGFHSVALRDDSTVVAWGSGDFAPVGLSNVTAISSGFSFDLALVQTSPLMIVRQPANRTLYSGMNARFTVGAVSSLPISYQWLANGTNIAGATNSALTLTNIQPADSGTYSAVLNNGNGLLTTSNATLAVTHSPPIFLSQTSNQLLTLGGNLNLAVTVGGSQPLSYQWRLNGKEIPGATASRFAVTNVVDANSGFYELVVSNVFGIATNSGIFATVNDLPSSLNAVELIWTTSTNKPWFAESITSHDGVEAAQSSPLSYTGEQSLLQTTVTGPGTLSFWCMLNSYWGQERLGFSIDGLQQFYLPTRTSGWQHKTIYIPEGNHVLEWSFYTPGATYLSDSAWVDQVTYSPGPTPPAFDTPPSSQVASAGTNAAWNISVFGTPPLSYQWQFNGTDINGATNTSLSLTNIQADNAGLYSIIVNNQYGTASSNATLSVNVAAPKVVVQPLNYRLPIHASIALTVTATGSEPFSYQWRLNGTNIDGATNRTLALSDVQQGDAGSYQVVVNNAYGSVASSNATVQVAPAFVLAWGRNTYGATNVPTTLTNPVAIAGGIFHSLSLRSDGTVLVWGDNYYGQTNVPAGLSNAVAIASGLDHILALKADGLVTAWGASNYHQATVPPHLSNVVAIAAGNFHSLALKGDGQVVTWGNNASGLTNVPTGLSNVVAIAGGAYHSLALKADGTVIAWGSNSQGQTNVPVGLSNVVAIAAGSYHNMALKSDGSLASWGDNSYGQTNVPVGLSNVVAVAAGYYHNMALKQDGTVLAWGKNNTDGQTNVPPGLGNVVAIAAGTYHSLALVNDDEPFIVRQPFSRLINAGADVTFAVTPAGMAPLGYQWQFNGTKINGATNASLVLTNVPLAGAGNYQCAVSNAIGLVTSLPASLIVLRTSPSFDSQVQFGSGGFGFQLNGLSGHGQVIVYSSADFVNWVPILTNGAVTGTLQVMDSSATNLPIRFYKVVEQ